MKDELKLQGETGLTTQNKNLAKTINMNLPVKPAIKSPKFLEIMHVPTK